MERSLILVGAKCIPALRLWGRTKSSSGAFDWGNTEEDRLPNYEKAMEEMDASSRFNQKAYSNIVTFVEVTVHLASSLPTTSLSRIPSFVETLRGPL